MDETKLIEQLDTQIQYYNNRLESIVNEIIEILKLDIPYFINEKVKEVFLKNIEFAEKLSDEDLKKIKNEIRLEGEKIANEIVSKLKEISLWTNLDEIPEDISSLKGNPAVWKILSDIGAKVKELLLNFKFPIDENEIIPYREPKRFIQGKYLKTSVEKYFKTLSELNQTKKKKQDIIDSKKREELLKKWESF